MSKNNSLCVKKTVSFDADLWGFVESQSRGNHSQVVREALEHLRDTMKKSGEADLRASTDVKKQTRKV
jgi:Arc/MetJ-type ribon-helix-helix transcriptional regulator